MFENKKYANDSKTRTDALPFVFLQFSVSQKTKSKIGAFFFFFLRLPVLHVKPNINHNGDCYCKGLQHTGVNLMLQKRKLIASVGIFVI